MAEPSPADVTQLLGQWSAGDREALDAMIPLVYDELRRMAHGHMARERAGHTMQATALVNDVYLKLKKEQSSAWKNRAQRIIQLERADVRSADARRAALIRR
jgi:hypothetical protein